MYNKQIIILHKNSYLLSNMLSSFINLVNFFKGLTFESVKKFFVTFGLYLWEILKEVWNDVKTNNGNFESKLHQIPVAKDSRKKCLIPFESDNLNRRKPGFERKLVF